MTETATALYELLQYGTTAGPIPVECTVRLEGQMQALRQAVSRCPRRRRIDPKNGFLQRAIDGQADELVGRVAFIVLHAGWSRIPNQRMAVYVHGLETDVIDLLDLIGFAPDKRR